MVHLNEIRCFGCNKRIGTYIDGDTEERKVVLRSLREHEMHWCPKKRALASLDNIPFLSEYELFCYSEARITRCVH